MKAENHLIRTIRITSTLASLIAAGGLVALLARGAWAAAADGFQPGVHNFANPFANAHRPATPPPAPPAPGAPPAAPGAQSPQNAKNNFFDDEDADSPDLAGESQGEKKPGATESVGGPTPTLKTGAQGGISMGGTPPSGVISHDDVAPIKIDDETAEGDKQIVTDFNFPDADILDIAKTLGKLTGKNFIFDKDVKGKVSIVSNSPITVGDAWRAFLTALDMNNFALIPSGKYIRIARQRDARDKQVKTYTGDYSPDTDALITRIFQLKYISSEDVIRTFRQLLPPTTRLVGYEQTNTVIVTDTGSIIDKMAKLLEILDVEGYDVGIEVIPVKFASAADLAKLIDTLIPGTSNSASAAHPGGFNRFGGGGGSSFQARKTKEGGVINTIIADERTNNLIINANAKGVEQIRELVAKLDQNRPVPSGGGKVHVRYLQYADAEKLAATLNNFSSQGASHPVSTPGGAGGGTGVNPVSATLFEGTIKIAADAPTNALVITASPTDFATLQRVINRLDIPRDEVYVEAIIMEVLLDRQFDFSVNAGLPNKGVMLQTNTDLLNFITQGVPGVGAVVGYLGNLPGSAGTTKTVNGVSTTVPDIAGMVKALQANSNAEVLATPQILTLDNTEATFDASEKLPIPQSNAVQGAVSTSIGHETVPLTIMIKPQINKVSNFVKLDVKTDMGDIDAQAASANVGGVTVYATIDRKTDTHIVVGDGDTAVIGGLTRNKVVKTVSKVPILGDIPLLGWLFSARHSESQKSNLLIFLTPHIVRQYGTMRAILDKKLKERDDFYEANAGGDDTMRYERDKMIRSLPDINELTSKKPRTTVNLDENDDTGAAEVPADGEPFTGGEKRKAEAPTEKSGPQTMQQPLPPLPPQTGAEALPPPAGEPPQPVPPPSEDAVPPTAPPAPTTEPTGT